MIRSAFFTDPVTFHDGDILEYVYGRGRRETVASLTHLYPHVVRSTTFEAHAPDLADLEVIFSTWCMPSLTDVQLDRLPNLQAVFYAAGSVKAFAPPLLRRGIVVCSAAAANAVAVAEFCLGQILLACKGYFRNTRDCRTAAGNSQQTAFHGAGCYGETIAIIGAGQIGRCLIELLRPFRLEVLVVDPFLSDDEATRLGVRRVALDDAFRMAYVVSNHLPDLPDLRRVLNGRLFATMRPNATFINTGRGAQVNEAELAAVLRDRPDLSALLDVTDPEPAHSDSPLYDLPNIQLSSHLAGAHDDEVLRMADAMIEEFNCWQAGKRLQYSISQEALERMA